MGEMENVTDLISIGVSPHNVLGIDEDNDRDEVLLKQRRKESNEDEKKLSFLYNMSESETGFDYEGKKLEIKNIMNDMLDCKHKIDKKDHQRKHDTNAWKKKMDKYDEDGFDIENDDQFMKRIKERIKSTMSMIHDYTPTNAPTLSVHWRSDKNEMGFIKDTDLNKLMRNKPGVARRYRKQQENKAKGKVSIPAVPDDPLPPCKQSKKDLNLFPQLQPIKRKSIEIVRRTKQKPPSLQFHSKPL